MNDIAYNVFVFISKHEMNIMSIHKLTYSKPYKLNTAIYTFVLCSCAVNYGLTFRQDGLMKMG